jgi:peroxiredoxin Q/BCP
MLNRNQPAPDFRVGGKTLYDMLTDRAVVVFFFPKAFTPGCTREAKEFAKEFQNLQSRDCDVIGVSSDTQETNDRFRDSLGLPYPLVGDPTGDILRAYDVRWPLVGIAQRVTYAIGRNRKVLLAFHSELSMKAHAAEACGAVIAGGGVGTA